MRKNNFEFLFELTNVVNTSEMTIMEATKLKDGRPKYKMKTRLQEAETVNNNKRIYSTAICESIVHQLNPKAVNNSLLMEIDHPMFTAASANPEKAKARAAIIEINNCAAVIRKIMFENGQIIGIIETLSGFKGPDLANIINDGVNIGFSLRALGSVNNENGILKVQAPIAPITFDVVSNPSHANARVMSFIPESDISTLSKCEGIMFESSQEEYNLLEQLDNISRPDSSLEVKSFIDKVIAEQVANQLTNMTFNL